MTPTARSTTIQRSLLRRTAGAVLSCLVGACVLLGPAGAPARGTALDPRTIRSATLQNGLRVVVCEDAASSVVAVEVVVKVGAADDPPGEEGISHLAEHVCWAGGEGGQDPRLRIEEMGGVTNAGALRDYTRFYATLPAGEFALGLRALADMTLRDSFDERTVSRERGIILEESAIRQEQPEAVLNDLAFAALYGGRHPYGRPLEGSEESLSRVGAARLARFHDLWYAPNNMAVVVAGNVRFDTVMSEVAAIFGDLQPRAAPARLSPPPERPSRGGERVIETNFGEAYVLAAFVGPAGPEPVQVCATDVLATLLSHGRRGRLVQELQERRELAKEIGIVFLTQRDRALFGVRAVCDAGNVAAVKEVIEGELARLARDPVPAEELVSAKRLLSAGYAFANETPGDRAATLAFYEVVDSYRAASYYLARVRSVTASDIVRVAAWYAGEPLWIVLLPKRDAR